MKGLQPDGCSPFNVLDAIVNEQCFFRLQVIFSTDVTEGFRVGFAFAELIGKIHLFKVGVKGFFPALGLELAFKGLSVDFVGIAQSKNTFPGFKFLQKIQFFKRKVEQHTVPGCNNLVG